MSSNVKEARNVGKQSDTRFLPLEKNNNNKITQ